MNFSKMSNISSSVFEYRVKPSTQALIACLISSNNCGIVDRKYADAFLGSWKTLVETKVHCGAIISQASYELWSSGHCQELKQNSIDAKCAIR